MEARTEMGEAVGLTIKKHAPAADFVGSGQRRGSRRTKEQEALLECRREVSPAGEQPRWVRAEEKVAQTSALERWVGQLQPGPEKKEVAEQAGMADVAERTYR